MDATWTSMPACPKPHDMGEPRPPGSSTPRRGSVRALFHCRRRRSGARPAAVVGQPDSVSERARRQDRLPHLRSKHWRPAQIKAGVEPVRGLYDLRHTCATFALRAGVPVFAVSRFIGSSIAMIDRHYGHPPVTAANTPLRSWTRSRSSGPWTLGGRRPEAAQTRSATAIRGALGGGLGGAWTLGGRRCSFSSPLPTTKTADQQHL